MSPVSRRRRGCCPVIRPELSARAGKRPRADGERTGAGGEPYCPGQPPPWNGPIPGQPLPCHTGCSGWGAALGICGVDGGDGCLLATMTGRDSTPSPEPPCVLTASTVIASTADAATNRATLPAKNASQ